MTDREAFVQGTLRCEVASCGEYAVALVQLGPPDQDVVARCGIHIEGKIVKLNKRADLALQLQVSNAEKDFGTGG